MTIQLTFFRSLLLFVIYTRYADLAFFHGKTLRPVMARNKTFLDHQAIRNVKGIGLKKLGQIDPYLVPMLQVNALAGGD